MTQGKSTLLTCGVVELGEEGEDAVELVLGGGGEVGLLINDEGELRTLVLEEGGELLVEQFAVAFDLPKPTGALVTEVTPGSIQQEDIILEFNGQKVESISGLRNAVSMIDPGSKVNLSVHRDGRKLKKTVTIKAHPEAGGGPGTLAHTLGIEVDPLDDKLAQQLNYQNETGVVVKRVETGSPAAKVGIKPGALVIRVNRTTVTTPEEFYDALEEASKVSDRVLLLVRQGQAMRFVSLKLNK